MVVFFRSVRWLCTRPLGAALLGILAGAALAVFIH